MPMKRRKTKHGRLTSGKVNVLESTVGRNGDQKGGGQGGVGRSWQEGLNQGRGAACQHVISIGSMEERPVK